MYVASGSAGHQTVVLNKMQAVQIAGQTKNFLLDTAASASIINNQLAKKLNLKGTPILREMFKFMVVGNDCSNIQANYHTLPTLAVNSAIATFTFFSSRCRSDSLLY